MQAGAPNHLALLDKGNTHMVLSCRQGGFLSGRTTADND
jgi:hypothetical protein